LAFDYLRAHVRWRARKRVGRHSLATLWHLSAQAQIAQFYFVIACQKHIARLDVAVNDSIRMQVMQTFRRLPCPFNHSIWVYFGLVFFVPIDSLGQVTILHKKTD
jgi:hypothetical protein